MNELIKIRQNDNNEQVVNGRELHEFLGVGTAYKDWFPRMVKYGFVENIDFVTVAQKRATAQGNQTGYIDHALKLDMAKEISMIQRTDKGKQARCYFIECEERLKKQYLPQTPEQQIVLLAQGNVNLNKRLEQVQNEVTNLKERFGLPATQAAVLKGIRNLRIIQLLGGKDSNAYHELSRVVFAEIGKDFKKRFGVPRYDAIPLSNYDEAIEYTKSWRPYHGVRQQIHHWQSVMQIDRWNCFE